MADPNSRSGARYADPALLAFVERVHVPHDAALQRAFDAPVCTTCRRSRSRLSEGKLLGLLVALARARNVVEVGTLAGYSAIHIARALPPGGKLHTIELEPKHAQVARENLAAAGLAERVQVHVGPAGPGAADARAARPVRRACFSTPTRKAIREYARWAAQNLRPGRHPARRQRVLLRRAAGGHRRPRARCGASTKSCRRRSTACAFRRRTGSCWRFAGELSAARRGR